ncbi:hypothetical protein [Cellulomonas sp. IC4_254]|uniref:hypothetical protein n=1 Tax=Cellulomonas sp. IC4_254 TaxID=2714040 RepID=UPI00196B3C66|nr:hypothetical protein [Cellulomonas sp. IC4_254]
MLAVLTAAVVLLWRPGSAVSSRVRRLGSRGAVTPAGPARLLRSPRWRRGATPDPAAFLGTVVTGVAAEVRAGRSPADAWRLVLGVPVGPDGVPTADDLLVAVLPAGPRRQGGGPAGGVAGGPEVGLVRRRVASNPEADPVRRRVAGVLAAGRLAAELGAPTAGVLEECARALAADADAETAVRSALAGPRQTTTLLTWLPVLGVALGTLLGADPLGTLLGGGGGTAAGIGGLVLTLLGRRWTRRMVADARTAGSGLATATTAGAGLVTTAWAGPAGAAGVGPATTTGSRLATTAGAGLVAAAGAGLATTTAAGLAATPGVGPAAGRPGPVSAGPDPPAMAGLAAETVDGTRGGAGAVAWTGPGTGVVAAVGARGG